MKAFSLLFILFLTSCSNLSPAIKYPPKGDLQLQQLEQGISYHVGSPVRWGGKIVSVENEAEYTRIEILSYPLDYYGRPQTHQEYGMRFVIQANKFLDPAVYKKDIPVTVAGTLEGEIEKKIGNKALKLPLVNVSDLQLWQTYQRPDYYLDYEFGYYPNYRFRYGYPYRYPYRPFSRFYRCD